jgi:magnesium chelatase family protein
MVKESKERIKASLRSCGIMLPPKKIILNLAPSDIRKVGTRFDLPMAVGILQLLYNPVGPVQELFDQSLFF